MWIVMFFSTFNPLNLGLASATQYLLSVFLLTVLIFQSPQSGISFCNFNEWLKKRGEYITFQSPQSGISFCNIKLSDWIGEEAER